MVTELLHTGTQLVYRGFDPRILDTLREVLLIGDKVVTIHAQVCEIDDLHNYVIPTSTKLCIFECSGDVDNDMILEKHLEIEKTIKL